MNRDVIEVRDSAVIASEINYIKRRTCEQVLSASVEIGRLLCEAKDAVPQGEWMSWLEENVAYSQSTANNLMALYREYGEKAQIGFFEENRLEIFGNLSPSQALALIPLPYAERKAYVEEHDMTDTSVRDIQKEIAARKAAEEALADAKVDIEALENDVAALKEELAAAKEKPEAPQVQIDVEGEKEAVRQEVTAAKEKEIEKIAKKLEKAEKELEKAKGEKEAAERGAEARAEAAKESAKEEGRAEAAAEIAALKEQNEKLARAAKSSADAAVQKFGVHFELWQKEGQVLCAALADVDPAVAAKLAAGMRQVMKAVETTIEGYRE